MEVYRYDLDGEMYPLPIRFNRGDCVNITELFGVEGNAAIVDELIWRADKLGLYGEIYFRSWK